MKATGDNPSANRLPKGVTDQAVADAVVRSGYPLQTVIARELQSDFHVIEEWDYIDRETNEHCSLDMHAYRRIDLPRAAHFDPDLTLLLECKRADLPYVFFESAVPRKPYDFPWVFGFQREHFDLYQVGTGHRELTPPNFLRLSDFPFVGAGPPICSTFTKAERKGKGLGLSGEVPFKGVILPLISALHHWAQMRKSSGRAQQTYFPSLALAVCVLDAAIVIARGTPELADLELVPWVRVVRHESLKDRDWIRYRHYAVDFVHREYFRVFVKDNVMPFAKAFADRLAERESLLLSGKGQVADWNNWTWQDLKPVG